MANHFSILAMNSVKRQNDRILKEELPGSVGAQYATGNQWRNNSRKNEGMAPKQKKKLTLPYVKWIANGNLLYDSGNSNRGSVSI